MVKFKAARVVAGNRVIRAVVAGVVGIVSAVLI